MSVVWLTSFIVNPLESNVFTFQSLNLVIYLNIFSCLSFVFYSLLYNLNISLQRPPNSLVILKMFGECMVSLHLLIIFLCFSFDNNKRHLGNTTNNILVVTSFIGPLALAITYWYNACLAHNLYITFYSYKNTYPKRIHFYKVASYIVVAVVLVFSVMFNKGIRPGNLFLADFYGDFYLGVFYFLGFLVNIYILIKIYYIIYRKEADFVFTDSLNDIRRKELFDNFVKRQVISIVLFIICYFPNNLIQVINLFYTSKFCEVSCWYYQIFVFLMSSSCLVDFCFKMTEPFMIKYLTMMFKFFKEGKTNVEAIDTTEISQKEDLSFIYQESAEGLNEGTEMKNLQKLNNLEKNQNDNDSNSPMTKLRIPTKQSCSDLNNISDMTNDFNLLNKNLEYSDFITRLIGLVLIIKDYDIYDKDNKYKTILKFELPLSPTYYEEKSDKRTYSQNKFPAWLSKELKEEKYKGLKVTVRKYAPLIFHHLLKVDGITINDFIASLDPMTNFKQIANSFASGGRSANPILFTHDRKYLIKTVSKDEKDTFIKMLPEFHRRMVNDKSLLCRIKKDDSHIIIMKNMCELPSSSKIYTFDMKGSTVDREVINKVNLKVLKNASEPERVKVLEKYSKEVLKDKDFINLELKFNVSAEDAELLNMMVKSDAEYLSKHYVTDYSLFVTIHKYNEEDIQNKSYRTMISTDKKYMFSFSIIDYLGDYDTMKLLEHTFKNAKAYFKSGNDTTNFSVQPPDEYSKRFISFISKCTEETKF